MTQALPRLIVTEPAGRRLVPLEKAVLTLGRRSESDVRISGVGVSRHHAEIAALDGAWRIRDLDSKFGTFVNGERRVEHTLQHGDRIRLGDSAETEILFLVGDEEPAGDRSAVSAATELRHLAALLGGLRALGSGRVLDDVLALVLDSAIDVTSAERGFIMLADEQGRLEFKLGRGRGRVTLSGRTFETSRKIPESVFATGEVRIEKDLMDANMAPQHMGTVALGIRHVVCAPLRLVRYVEKAEERSEDRAIGVLYLDSREAGGQRFAAAKPALETLSVEAAMAIENARLYREALERAKLDQELKVAAAIQRALLPKSNRSGAFFATAAVSVPCRAVGGDFFDYVDVDSNRFGFIVGDVAGKGAPAALLASAVLGMFGAEASYQTRPAAVITRMNQGLFRRGIEGRFLSAFYGILDPDGSLQYSNAGHNAPVVITRDCVRRLDTGGMLLGLFEHAAFEEEALTLSPGDLLVAFSDGVSEAFNEANEEYGDARLLEALDRYRGQPPAELLEALLADVRGFCGRATPNDDVTMLVLQYNG